MASIRVFLRRRRRAIAAASCLAMTLSVATAIQASPAVAATGLSVHSAAMTVQVAPDGGITSVSFADGRVWQLGGRSLLTAGSNTNSPDQCSPVGDASATADDGAQWQTTCTDSAGHTTTLTEALAPAGDSVSWTVQVQSTSGTYGKGIWTKLTGWTDGQTRQFWTTWGQSPNAPLGQNPTWTDPLSAAPFTNMTLPYGGHAVSGTNGFSVPIFTIVEPGTDHSLSLVQSPADVLLDASLVTDTAGDVQFGRFDNRLTPDQPVSFHMNLVPSAADWRGGLGWITSHYPNYFQPTEKDLANQLSGLDSYSYYPGPFTAEQQADLSAMGYRTNWDASFSWPYMGEFMPPVSSPDTMWRPFGPNVHPGAPTTMSVNDLSQTIRNWTGAGFHQLAYFNTTEFGTGIQSPRPPQTKQCSDPQLWTSPNDYLYCDFADAMLRDAAGNPTFSWENAVVMDPGTPSYQQHLLEQAEALLTQVPYSGIDIDRLDWMEQFNTHADDRLSWYNGAPARSLITSWKQLISKLAPLLHGMGKALFVSPTDSKRIDWMNGTDGFLSEFNDGGLSTNLDAFLGLDKPVEGWNNNLSSNPDEFLQRFLHMGVYPMAPAPGNDHGIGQSATYEKYYRDYGPMFAALQGKRWLLTPHVVQVTNSNALANVFTVPDGVIVPVTQGGAETSAELTLRGLQKAVPGLDLSRPEYLSPGSGEWHPLTTVRSEGDVVNTTVALARGAALVRFLTYKAETNLPPSIGITSSGKWVSETSPVTVTETVRNDAVTAIQDVSAALQVPAGWSAEEQGGPVASMAPGDTATFQWKVSAPADSSSTPQTITSTVTFRRGADVETEDAAILLAAGVRPTVSGQRLDATTQGDWKGSYGASGYFVANDGQAAPHGVQVVLPSAPTYTWADNTSDTRALQKADSTSRIASTWYGTDFSFTVNTTDGQVHQLAIYTLDWDYRTNQGPREETLTATDSFNDVLDVADPGFFGTGKYIIWNVQGQVTINVHMVFGGNSVGGNAVVSGIFIDPQG